SPQSHHASLTTRDAAPPLYRPAPRTWMPLHFEKTIEPRIALIPRINAFPIRAIRDIRGSLSFLPGSLATWLAGVKTLHDAHPNPPDDPLNDTHISSRPKPHPRRGHRPKRFLPRQHPRHPRPA